MDGKDTKPILVLTGQTATGKTGLALKLANEFPIEIISADARQIYSGMDIGTGKIGTDDTLEQKDQQWFLNNVPIHGINLVTPDQTFSAMNFARYAHQKIIDIIQRGHIPVFVGGTAFYLMSLFEPHEQQSVPPNSELRNKWQQQFTQLDKIQFVSSLQQELAQTNPVRLAQMNTSDRQNPRRLMRAIEIALAPHSEVQTSSQHQYHPQLIALTAPTHFLTQKITTRIEEMISLGLESEVTELRKTYDWQTPGMQTIGYHEWQPYFSGHTTHADVQTQIITHNRQYAKRQMTYLKKNPQITWFDISESSQVESCYQQCEKLLTTFHALVKA